MLSEVEVRIKEDIIKRLKEALSKLRNCRFDEEYGIIQEIADRKEELKSLVGLEETDQIVDELYQQIMPRNV